TTGRLPVAPVGREIQASGWPVTGRASKNPGSGGTAGAPASGASGLTGDASGTQASTGGGSDDAPRSGGADPRQAVATTSARTEARGFTARGYAPGVAATTRRSAGAPRELERPGDPECELDVRLVAEGDVEDAELPGLGDLGN